MYDAHILEFRLYKAKCTGSAFWARHQSILEKTWVEKNDVIQEALLLTLEGCGPLLWCRLIDWMRIVTHHGRNGKLLPRFEEFINDYQENNSNDCLLKSAKYQPDQIVLQLASRFLDKASLKGPRIYNAMKALMQGETMKNVGQSIGVSESRVSQIFKQLAQSIVVMVFLWMPGFVQAQELHSCSSIEWTLEEENDLARFLFTRENLTTGTSTTVVFDRDTRSASCDEMGLIVGHTYRLTIVAEDSHFQHSEPASVEIVYAEPVMTDPPVLRDLCISGTYQGAPIQFCAEVPE